jgi:hypothetical protein
MNQNVNMLTRLALLSAGIYVGLLLTLRLTTILVARFTDVIVGIHVSRLRMAVLFGLAWFVSFILAWRILRLDR